ncbi:UNVERIFIED_CONTAM: Calcium-dependent protein kinase [Sesamum radiatum]|uniref:non-specific serine/threonine protein kinase n=1 Tax=Sesamum radiatum TaxID=300843 RepID=A0AAW2P2X2_SESRA
MGSCFSTTKVSGANGNAPSITTTAVNFHFGNRRAPRPSQAPQNKRSLPIILRRQEKLTRHRSNRSRISRILQRSQLGSFLVAREQILGKLLGHGQFGYTYVAIDKSNGDRVAVKRIEKNKMVLPIAVEDVKREVKILKALAGHENVVHFYNAFEDDSYVYIVMELCEGGELLDRILSKKDSRYTEKDAAIVVRQMLKVAAECHLHGFVHRDMKPEVTTASLSSTGSQEQAGLPPQTMARDNMLLKIL